MGLVENRGGSRDDEDGVTDFSDEDRVEDGLVATKVLVGNPGAEKRTDIDPERVEGGQREGNLLAQAKGTRLSFGAVGVDGSTGRGGGGVAVFVEAALVDEVGVDDDSTVVRHALAQLYETNGEDLPGDLLGNTAQRAHLLLGREVIPVGGQVAFLESGLALGEEIGWRRVCVSLWVLALRIARSIHKGTVQSGGLLCKV